MSQNALELFKKKEEELLRINKELDEKKRTIFEDFVLTSPTPTLSDRSLVTEG
jgi:hypothetical protein